MAIDAIGKVQTYERQLRELHRFKRPEKLVNILYYIIGEECYRNDEGIDEFHDNWNNLATEKLIIKYSKIKRLNIMGKGNTCVFGIMKDVLYRLG